MADITGTPGNDILVGTPDNDNLIGGTGDDTYLFGRSFGNDIIIDDGGDPLDTIEFTPDVLSADIQVTRDASHLYLTILDTGETLTLYSWFDPTYQVDQVIFGDGTVWDAAALETSIVVPSGTGGDDSLWGGPGNDLLDGFAGFDSLEGGSGNDTLIGGLDDDYLSGGNGSDTYIYAIGDGFDGIYDGGTNPGDIDVLQFGPGILSTDIGVTRDSNNLYLTLTTTGEQLTLYSWFSDPVGGQIESVMFGGGTVWSAADLTTMAGGPVGTEGSDILIGTPGTDTLSGLGGDDTLYGEEGDDVLDGGTGSDILVGGLGSDLYMFDRGYSQDFIEDVGGDLDTIQFAPGILPSEIVVTRDISSLLLTISGTDDRLILGNWFSDLVYTIERVQFGDGTAWSAVDLDALITAPIGTSGGEVLVGTTGDDAIYGLDGADKLYGEDGNDVLDGGSGIDTLVGGRGDDTYYVDDIFDRVFESPLDIPEGSSVPNYIDHSLEGLSGGNDTVVSSADFTIGNGLENLLLVGTGDISGTGNALDNTITGNDGNNVLSGGAGNDVLDGGMGDDQLYGGSGNDIYVFGRGFGFDTAFESGGILADTDAVRLVGGLTLGGILVTHNGSDVFLTIADTGEQLTLLGSLTDTTKRIEHAIFDDGSVWEITPTGLLFLRSTVGTAGDDTLRGTNWADTLDGAGGNDTIYGNAGNDNLIGGDGNDTLDGMAGADNMAGGLGDDIFVVGESGDTVVENAGEGIDTVLSHVNYTLGDNLENLTLTDYSRISGTGNALDNVITGNAVHNVLSGEGGNDSLNGGAGNDTYLYAAGDGNDRITEFSGTDTLRFAAGLTSSNIAVSSNANDLILTVSLTGSQIAIADWFTDPAYQVERAEFADGSVWQITDTGLVLLTPAPGGGTPGPDNLTGTSGADTINADAGDDTLAGGQGNDTLIGGAGSDTYVFNLGDGVDTIDDLALSGEGNALQLGTGINPTALTLSFDGGVLVLNLGGGDQLRLTNFDPNDVYGAHAVETFTFADGTVLTYAELIDRGFDLVGTAGDDVIYGTNGVDRIVGGDGNDTIIGGGGNDTIDGGAGNDTITGGSGDNVIQGGEGDDIINGGAGNDTLYGGTGNDTYRFDAGNGSDVIYDSASEFNTLVFGPGVNPGSITLNLGSLFLNIGNDEGVHLENFDPNDAFGTSIIQNFVFDDGTTLDLASLLALGFDIDGTDADDVLNGTSVTDRITGGIGNDTLAGGAGDDTYYYNQGDGLDQLTDTSGTDTVSFGAGIAFANTVVRTEVGIAHLRLLDADGNETNAGIDIALNGDGTSPIEAFAYADGSSHTLADLSITTQTWYGDKKANTIITGRNDDTVYAGKGGDTVYTGTGNDTLYGEKGNDKLYGEGGNDKLYGGKGDDLLDGGCGNDLLDGGKGHNTLIGGKGNDTLLLGKDSENTIRFNQGDGWDTLKTSTKDEGHDNDIQFGSGITQNNLWFSRTGNDLTINVLGTSDGMTVEGWYSNKHKPIEEFKTSNGYELEDKQIGLLVQAMASFTPAPGSGNALPTEMPDQLQATLAAAWES